MRFADGWSGWKPIRPPLTAGELAFGGREVMEILAVRPGLSWARPCDTSWSVSSRSRA